MCCCKPQTFVLAALVTNLVDPKAQVPSHVAANSGFRVTNFEQEHLFLLMRIFPKVIFLQLLQKWLCGLIWKI
jgi:hypothetical protein